MTSFRVPPIKPRGSMPEYQQQMAPATAGADVSARLSDDAARIYGQTGGNDARQLDAMGRSISQAAKVGHGLYVDYQQTKAREAFLTYKQEGMKVQAELETLLGKDAADPKNGVQAKMTAWRADARGRLAKDLGGMAAEMFAQGVSQEDAAMDAWATKKVHTEGIRYADKTGRAFMALKDDEALANVMKPEAFGLAMGQIRRLYEEEAARHGLDDTWVDAQLTEHRQKVLTQAVRDSISGEQTRKADTLLNAYGPLFGGNKEGLLAQNAAKKRELTARARAEEARRESEQLAAVTDSKATSFVTRLKAGEDEQKIQEEILGLPHKERGPVNSLYHAYRSVWRQAQEETRQDGIIDNRLKMDTMSPGEAYTFVAGLPETTWAERQIKKQAQVDYGTMASHAGLSRTTDPDARDTLVDAITYAEVKSGKELRAHPEAAKIAKKDLEKLVNDLEGASTIKESDLKTAFRWAIGKDENSPEGGTLSSSEKAEFMRFSEWAAIQAGQSNRAKEPAYVKELARQWRMDGETPAKAGFGYGRDARLSKAANDPQWLPDLPPADKARIGAMFEENPEGARMWLEKYGNNRELAMRAYLKSEREQARGPRIREAAQ